MFLLLMKMNHQKFFLLKSFGSIGFGGSCESDWLGGHPDPEPNVNVHVWEQVAS